MPDDGKSFHDFVHSTRRYLSLLSGFVSGLILRKCGIKEGSPSGSLSQLTVERKDFQTADMAAEPIDISSSDSEWDLDEIREYDNSLLGDSASSSDPRRIRSWADSASTNSTANVGPSQKSTSRLSAFNRDVSNLARQTHNGASVTDHDRLPANAFSQTFATIGNSSNGYEPHLSGIVSEEARLPHFQSHVAALTNLTENLGNGKRCQSDRKIYNSHKMPSSGMSHVQDQLGRGNDDDIIMYEKSGSRVLPQSFMPRKIVSTAQHAISADTGFRSGPGEERVGEYDERLIYQAALQDLNQLKVEISLPDGLLSVPLLRHQKIALAWLLQKESSVCCTGGILADDQGLGKTISMIALIQIQKLMQSKSKSDDKSHQATEALNLDDDEVGDANAFEKGEKGGESRDLILIPEASTSTREFQARRPLAGTLVVCPASVLRQWYRELDEKVSLEAKLRVLVYHGSNRTKDPVELARYDVVLTTYAIVANEVPPVTSGDDDEQDTKDGEKYGLTSEFSGSKKRKQTAHASKKRKKGKKGIDSSTIDSNCGTIAKVRWLRVILDEAQTIKNHRTQVARACAGFKAKSRWCLSGTPIQNAIDELFSYFRFLRYEPYTTYKSFCSTLKNPISRNSVQGYKKLNAVLRAVMLRRTKGTFIDGEPIISLPPKTINMVQVNFSDEEWEFYKKLEADSRSQFRAYAAAGTLNQNYANILLLLLRLRQACDHPLLVKGFSSDSIGKHSMHMAKNLPKEMLINLMKDLETSSAICCLCSDPPEDAVVTMCGHVFCYQCVSECLRGDENTCPSPECKAQIGPDVVYSKATLRSCLYGDDHRDGSPSSEPNKSLVLQNDYSSAKITAALEILQSHCKSNSRHSELHGIVGYSELTACSGKELLVSAGGVENVTQATGSGAHSEGPKKAIVFSQWTGMLNLVEMSLNQSSLKYRRLDGTMTLSARDKAVKEFNTNPEVTVMLMSLKAGNLGLNMVAATHVILLDLWWNPTTEDQAIDRAHRIGQTQPVTVSRLTVKGTVEERILALQEEKRKMVASAFGEDQSGSSGTRLTVEDLQFLFMGSR